MMQKFHRVDNVHQVDLTIEYVDIGRVIVCTISNDEGELMASGASQCHPHDEDNPRLGELIALRRALGEFEDTIAWCVRNEGQLDG